MDSSITHEQAVHINRPPTRKSSFSEIQLEIKAAKDPQHHGEVFIKHGTKHKNNSACARRTAKRCQEFANCKPHIMEVGGVKVRDKRHDKALGFKEG
jgi:hypothetical protein